ncbi:DUF6069 family protein [Haloechinothrix alba]|nr:DUF6069 family protein [Haloechinothrix alba]
MTQTYAAQQSTASIPTRLTHRINWWQAITAGVVLSGLVNLALYLIGHLAGATFLVAAESGSDEVTAGMILFFSTVPLAVGTALAVLLANWWTWVLRLAQVIGAALALATIAGIFAAEAGTGTAISLTVMHVVVAVAVVLILEVVRGTHRHNRRAE